MNLIPSTDKNCQHIHFIYEFTKLKLIILLIFRFLKVKEVCIFLKVFEIILKLEIFFSIKNLIFLELIKLIKLSYFFYILAFDYFLIKNIGKK